MSADPATIRALNTLRFLAVDGVQTANSGHPGLPMGGAAMAYTIWTRHLRHDPKNPKWFDRDRFILSGGHGSMLLYALLHLTGYDVTLDDLKQFRQWGSITPGHPEYGLTPGVETTTGPLGQGFANGVGMAIAEAKLAAHFNKPGINIIDHYTYAIVTDGDLMEGVTAEAASLAGHLQLGKLIYLYDDNHISIDGDTVNTFTEDRGKRFEAYGWHVQYVKDGNDVDEIDKAIIAAKLDPRPSLIICKTIIGYGLPNRQGTARAHGEPPGDEELNAAKEKAGWPLEPRFLVPEDMLNHYRIAINKGSELVTGWNKKLAEYMGQFPQEGSELLRRIEGRLPENWEVMLPDFAADPKGIATRAASGQVINAMAPGVPELTGGSADLSPSTNTWIKGEDSFQARTQNGRNFYFGVREHGMGSVVNGMAYHGGLVPYGATFLVFSDYMRPAVRLSALSHLHAIWIFTHDSIGLGEDGPTHQPVEQLAALRAIPHLSVIRPADANEVSAAWKVALQNSSGPTALLLSRQPVSVLSRQIYAPASRLEKGAYILADLGKGKPDVILMASGAEVSLIATAGDLLAKQGLNVRLVSFPSWDLFKSQPVEYRKSVLPDDITARLAVEAGSPFGWREWVGDRGDILAIDGYGASAPAKVLFEKYGFTETNIVAKAKALLEKQSR